MPLSRRESFAAMRANAKNLVRCEVCKKSMASATCKTCNRHVCTNCYEYSDVVTCHVCKVPAVACPKCGSPQVQAMKAGLSGGGALVGAAFLGPLGAILGATANANDVHAVCVRCGHTWRPRLVR